MEILGSGAVVSLGEAGVLGRLETTAVRLADTARKSGTACGDAAAIVAEEFWKGLRYQCAAGEVAEIRRIFTDRFVRRIGNDAEPEAAAIIVETLVNTGGGRDVVAESATADSPEVAGVPPAPEATTNDAGTDEPIKGDAPAAAEVVPDDALNESEEVAAEPAPSGAEDANDTEVPKQTETNQNAADARATEPYRFEDCTVTMVVNLLPADKGLRTAVVSMRTHDFAPRILSCTIGEASAASELFPTIEKAVEQYRSALPVLAIEKFRTQKTTAKQKKTATARTLKGAKAAGASPTVGAAAQEVVRTSLF